MKSISFLLFLCMPLYAQINTFSTGQAISAQAINENFQFLKPFYKEGFITEINRSAPFIPNNTSGTYIDSSTLKMHSPDGLKITCPGQVSSLSECALVERLGFSLDITEAGVYKVCAVFSLRLSAMNQLATVHLNKVDVNANILESPYAGTLYYNNNAAEVSSQVETCSTYTLSIDEHFFVPFFSSGSGTTTLDMAGPGGGLGDRTAVKFYIERKR